MEDSEFENSEALRYWFDSLNSKLSRHSTKAIWKHHLKRYCNWIGKSPDALIAERKEQLKSEDERVKHLAEQNLKRFLSELDFAENTKRSYFMAVRNFYKRNYCELYFFRRDGPGTETVSEGARAATKDDIRSMLEVSNPRVRALLLFLKDTGLAESDVVKLKLSDLGVRAVAEIFGLEAPVPIIVRRKKTGKLTLTFMGKESLSALKTTLRIRKQGSPDFQIRRYGHVVKAGLMPENLELDSPLFRSYEKFFARNNPSRPIRHLSPNAVNVIVRKAAVQAGIWKEGFSAHALRRFFQTSLETAGTNPNWTKRMMGHALNGSEEPYSQPQLEVLREAYVKAYPSLAVNEVTAQKSMLEALQAQNEALLLADKNKDAELSLLKAQFLELRAMVEKLLKES